MGKKTNHDLEKVKNDPISYLEDRWWMMCKKAIFIKNRVKKSVFRFFLYFSIAIHGFLFFKSKCGAAAIRA